MLDRFLGKIAETQDNFAVDGNRRKECVGRVVGRCFEELTLKEQSWRGVGLIFGPGSQDTGFPASSFTIAGIPVASVSGILDRLESSQDVLYFASGLLASKTGPEAMNEFHLMWSMELNRGSPLETEDKARLLELLLRLGPEFGESDESGF